MSGSDALVRLGLSSDRARRATAVLAAERRSLESAVKRTLPYLSRRKIKVSALEPSPVIYGDALGELLAPMHVMAVDVGGARGALVVDGKAVAHGLDGVLGGSGELPELDPSGLSPAQSALAVRLARGLLEAFASVLGKLGMRLTESAEDAGGAPGGLLVACAVTIGEDETRGTILLLVPAGAVPEGALGVPKVLLAQTRTAAAMAQVDVEVVAELGRVRLPLRRLAGLRVGDVVRLPLPLDTAATVRVSTSVIFRGKPTTSGPQIAILIDARGE